MESAANQGPTTRGVVKHMLWTLPIAVGALWLAFRGVDGAGLWDALASTELRFVGVAMFLMIFNVGFRLLRWALIVRGYDREVSGAQLGRIGAIGYMAIDILPARLGELVRPLLLNRAGVPLGACVASIVLERLLDVAALAGLLFAVLAFGDLPALEVSLFGRTVDLAREGRIALLTLMVLLGVPVLVVPLAGERGLRFAARILRRLPRRLAKIAFNLLRSFMEGLKRMGRPAAVAGSLLTAAVWVVNVGVLWCLASSQSVDLSAWEATVVTIVVSLCLLVPSPAGGLGVFEAGGVAGLLLYGVDPDRAAAFAVTLHAVHVGMISLPGLVALPYEGLRFSQLWSFRRPEG